MSKSAILFAFILLLGVVGCQNDGSSSKSTAKKSTQETTFPPLPENRRMDLFKKTIAVDVIAYDLGVSLSYNNPGSIQPVVSMIKPSSGDAKKGCKPVGRISFMFETGIGEEAEMYVHQGCKTFVWLDKGKKAFSNELTDEGRDFWNNFIPEDGNIQIPEGAETVPK